MKDCRLFLTVTLALGCLSARAFAQPALPQRESPAPAPTAEVSVTPTPEPTGTTSPPSADPVATLPALPQATAASDLAQRQAAGTPNSSPALSAGSLQTDGGVATVLAGSHLGFSLSAQDNDTDANGNAVADTVYFHWKTGGGSLNRSGAGTAWANTAEWTVPDTPGTYIISVNVNDTAYNGFTQTGKDADIVAGRHANDPLNDSPPPTKSIRVQVLPLVQKIQYRGNDGAWYDWGGPHSILKGRTFRFRAWSSKANGTFPAGYPNWTTSPGVSSYIEDSGGFRTCVATFTERSSSIGLLKNVTASVLTSSAVAQAVVGEIGLDRVDFADNHRIRKDASNLYYGIDSDEGVIEWDQTHDPAPLCYHGGQRIKARSFFWVLPYGFDATGLSIQGIGRGRAKNATAILDFPVQQLKQFGEYTVYDTAETKPMAASTNVFDKFGVRWQTKLNGTWVDIGLSQNKLCRVWRAPKNFFPLYETVVDVACRDTQTQGDALSIVLKIWDTFKDRNVGDARATTMRYWAEDSDSQTVTAAFFHSQSLESMIYPNSRIGSGVDQNGVPYSADVAHIGTCKAWVSLFRACVQVHGIDIHEIQVVPSEKFTISGKKAELLVKNWAFSGPGTAPAGRRPTWTHLGTEITDLSGLPGQGNVANPRAYFEDHALALYGGQYYDPSYGTGQISARGWENISIAGFRNMYSSPVVAVKSVTDVREMNFIDKGTGGQ